MTGRRILDACTGCGLPEARNHGFELCRPCYWRQYRGHLRRTWRGADLVAETAFLAEAGCPWTELPTKLGVTWDAVSLAHRRTGQPIPLRYRYRSGDLRVCVKV